MSNKKLIPCLISLLVVLALAAVFSRCVSLLKNDEIGNNEINDEISEKEEIQKGLEIPERLAGEAVLSLVSSQSACQKGEIVTVEIYLDSKGHLVDGVDVILNYPPQDLQLEYMDSVFLDESDSVFGIFPSPTVNQENGQIVFSALSVPGKSFQGKGKIASLKFEAEKAGETEIKFLFTPDSTVDSNVSSYEEPKDVLGKAVNLKLLIF